MKYSVKEVKLMTVPQGKRNAGSHYLQLTIQNAANPWAKAESFTSFCEPMIKVFEQYVAPATPTGRNDAFNRPILESKLLDPNKPIPAQYLEIPNVFPVVVPTPGEPWVRVDQLGNVPPEGERQYVTTVRVLCMKDIDNETGEASWMQGEVPEQKAMRILQQFYKPVSECGIYLGQAGTTEPIPLQGQQNKPAGNPQQGQGQQIPPAGNVQQGQGQQIPPAGNVVMPY